jgi:hypothetical protein
VHLDCLRLCGLLACISAGAEQLPEPQRGLQACRQLMSALERAGLHLHDVVLCCATHTPAPCWRRACPCQLWLLQCCCWRPCQLMLVPTPAAPAAVAHCGRAPTPRQRTTQAWAAAPRPRPSASCRPARAWLCVMGVGRLGSE